MTNQTIEKPAQITLIKEFVTKLSCDQALKDTVKLLKNSNPKWDWVGIYLLKGDKLILGHYAGSPTEHTTIDVGKGVCGTAVAKDKNLIIDDVNKLDNYIACSLETKSEIVVLIKDGETTLGQFDLDSDTINAFSFIDESFLQELAAIVAPALKEVLKNNN